MSANAPADAKPIPGPRRYDSWRASGLKAWLPSLGLTVILAVLVIPPIISLIQTCLTDATASSGATFFPSLINFRRLIGLDDLYTSAYHSLVFATLATILGLVVGGLLAWIVERTNAPFKGLAYITAVVSMGTPYILYVIAWIFLLGRAGPFFSLLNLVFGITDLPFNVFSMWGMVLIEGFLWSPLVFLILTAVFRNANVEMEEAARISGATVPSTIWHISMRLALPSIIGAAMFVFVRNLESFDVPVLIGMPGRVNLLTTEIYLSVTRVPADLGLAGAFSIVLVAIVGFLIWFIGRYTEKADRFASITGKGMRVRPLDLGAARWIAGLIILAYFFFVLVLPLLGLVWTSVMPFMRRFDIAGFKLITFDHYRQVLGDPTYITLAANTLIIAVGAATITMALTVFAGWLTVRRWPGSALLDQASTVSLIFPGIVLAVAVIQIALRLPFPAYGTLWIIAAAYVVRYLPYGMRYSYSGVLQIHRELEEAAGVAGATQIGILRKIVRPLLTPAIISGWLFIFLLASRELSIAVLLSGPNTQTVAVAMFNQLANGTSNELAALGILWTIFLTIFAVGFHFLTRRQPSAVAREH